MKHMNVSARQFHPALGDSGAELEIDLRLWYETSKKRGGFVAALRAAS